MMELGQEEVMGCKDSGHVIKGKRTKRQRAPQSPLAPALAMVSTSSSASSGGGGGGGGGEGERFSDNSGVMGSSSPTTSVEFAAAAATSTEEEEDMANCLILLAQGNIQKLSPSSLSLPEEQPSCNININVNKSSKVPVPAAGLCVYQCKTCDRCFPSFQALGGHRTSHKKPKVVINNNEEKLKTLLILEEEEENDHRFNHMNTTLSLKIAADRAAVAFTGNNNNKSNKVHECSVCGAEFSSGQALGGHMRRHRAFVNTTTTTTTATALSMATSGSLDHRNIHHQSREAKKPRNFLQLDLNLPAPEEDRRESKFAFASKEQVIVFSASSLVDCHY